MLLFSDADELRAYLRTIKTYDEFWERKEPCLSDAAMKEFSDWHIRQGDDPDAILEALKCLAVEEFSAEFSARLPNRVH